MKRFPFFLLLLLIALSPARAQNAVFGKNKVQYKSFEWRYIQTSHFDVYYAQDGYDLAAFAAQASEEAYDASH